MKGKDFVLLTVDIQESPDRIEEFFVELELEPDFPVLMDTDGQVSRDWKVYAYPSNYLLDTSGKIRYGYRGALEWDSEEVVEVIESLLLQ
jgi:peroxiredoxin